MATIFLLKSELLDVAQKFVRQADNLLAQNPDSEKNELLQERLRKAKVTAEEEKGSLAS